jgi:hypothetical protein
MEQLLRCMCPDAENEQIGSWWNAQRPFNLARGMHVTILMSLGATAKVYDVDAR